MRTAPSRLHVMILAGGRGERFWPLSRELRPKPLLDLGLEDTLLGATLRRAGALADLRDIRVVARARLGGVLRRELRGRGALLEEPAARNTGPAALLATWTAWTEDPGAEVLLLPSDHHIVGDAAFRRAVQSGRRLAREGFLVVFGVRPTGPEPDFGYVVPGESLGGDARKVRRFVEKPDRRRARELIRRHSALWNSGMFLWRADAFLEEASLREPSFAMWLRGTQEKTQAGASARKAFSRLPSVSVDRAVMERSDRVAMVPARFGWSDLGSWSSLYELLRPDRDGNAGWGKLITLKGRRNLAVNPEGLTVLAGVNDLLVVNAGNVLLVCPRSRARRMKEIVRELREAGYGDYL